MFSARGICPLDASILTKSPLRSLVFMARGAVLPDDLIKKYEDVGFVFGVGVDSDTSPSNAVYYIRQAKQESNRHGFYALWTIDRIRSMLNVASTPQWMKREFGSGPQRDDNRVKIQFGEGNQQAFELLTEVIDRKIDLNPVFVAPKNGLFFNEESRRRADPAEEACEIASRWLFRFADTNFVSPF